MRRIVSLLAVIMLIATMLFACSKPLDKMTVVELLDLGEKYLLEMNYEEAIICFDRLIEIEPRNVRGYLGAAEARIKLGKADEARAVLQLGYEATGDKQINDIIRDSFPLQQAELPTSSSQTEAGQQQAVNENTWLTVSAGGNHNVAIKGDGSLWTWGYNLQGQLGDGTKKSRTSPMKVMEGVAVASAGVSYTMVVRADGSLWAWGSNNYGQLGDGTTTDRITPVKVMDDVVSVVAANSYTMAIKADGSLWSWGANWSGRLGDGTTQDHIIPVKVMDGVVSVSMGGLHTMIIKTDGSLWAWGDFRSDERTIEYRTTPEKVMDGVVYISAGDQHNMAIKADGSLWAWGDNRYGQLGDGTQNFSASPVKVMDDVTAVSAGRLHTMAIKADGSLWAWGANWDGRLGDGTSQDRITPIRIMDSAAAISTSEGYAVVVKTDGSLWAWGYGKFGQVNDGTGGYRATPVPISSSGTLGGAPFATFAQEGAAFEQAYDKIYGWNLPNDYSTSVIIIYPNMTMLFSANEIEWMDVYDGKVIPDADGLSFTCVYKDYSGEHSFRLVYQNDQLWAIEGDEESVPFCMSEAIFTSCDIHEALKRIDEINNRVFEVCDD